MRVGPQNERAEFCGRPANRGKCRLKLKSVVLPICGLSPQNGKTVRLPVPAAVGIPRFAVFTGYINIPCVKNPQNGNPIRAAAYGGRKTANRQKRQIREMKASAATGDENLGERNPKIPRRGRRVTLCHSGARQVNGQKRGKIKPLGGGSRPASGGRDDMSRRGHGSSLKPLQRQGAGRSRAVRQTFFLRAKIFQRQKRRLRCPQSNRNLHTRRCAAE